jgi:hypothetical protein
MPLRQVGSTNSIAAGALSGVGLVLARPFRYCAASQTSRNTSPPDALYHYSTQAGLIGILRDSEIGATRTQYLNNHREYIHAVSLVRDVINERAKSSSGASVKVVLGEMLARVSDDLRWPRSVAARGI